MTPSPTPGRGTPAPAVVIPFDVVSLVGAWRPGVRRLTLETGEPLGPGRRVALKLDGAVGVNTPVLGTVRDVKGGAGLNTVVIEIDADREPVLRRVFDFLEGRATPPTARAPRYKLALPVVVQAAYSLTYMTTFSLSRGGCGIVWTGARPVSGTFLDLRLGNGARSARFRGRVRWVRPEGNGFKVGVGFLSGDDVMLEGLIAEKATTDTAT